MRILVINGSPKGANSNTMRVTSAFLRGYTRARSSEVTIVHVADKSVAHCRGCYYCWTYTPGVCVIRDDMTAVLKAYLESDLVVWSTPVHSFGISSLAKMVLDRLLPVYLPIIEERREDDGAAHPFRFDLSYQKYLVVATCGFYAYENNVEAIQKQFEVMYGDRVEFIVCPEGDLFAVPQLAYRTAAYLRTAEQAGAEFATAGAIAADTRDKLHVKHYSPVDYMAMANSNWYVFEKGMSRQDLLRARIHNYMVQMKLVYEPRAMQADEGVLEMHFDNDTYTCQFIMSQAGCSLVEEESEFRPHTLRVITSYTLWERISREGMAVQNQARSKGEPGQSDFNSLVRLVSSLALRHKAETLRL